MQLAAATAAAPIAAAINERIAMAATVKGAIESGFQINQLSAVNGPGRNQVNLLIGKLDTETSAQAFQFVLQILEAQIAALTAKLADL